MKIKRSWNSHIGGILHECKKKRQEKLKFCSELLKRLPMLMMAMMRLMPVLPCQASCKTPNTVNRTMTGAGHLKPRETHNQSSLTSLVGLLKDVPRVLLSGGLDILYVGCPEGMSACGESGLWYIRGVLGPRLLCWKTRLPNLYTSFLSGTDTNMPVL